MELHNKIKTYLESNSWTLKSSNDKFLNMAPPANLELSEDYTLKIFRVSTNNDYYSYLDRITNIISGIYGISTDDLKDSLEQDGEVLAVRVIDRETTSGDMKLSIFDKWLSTIKQLLYDTAGFALEKQPVLANMPAEAEIYVDKCRFLQTKKGSFVARILLPYDAIIRPVGLFREEVKASSVNTKLYKSLSFVNSQILKNEPISYTPQFFEQHRDSINLDMLKTINTLIKYNDFQSVEYTFSRQQTAQNQVSFAEISDHKTKNLDELILKVENEVIEPPIPIEITGFVTYLSIKQMDYEKNTIKILASHDRIGPLNLKIRLDEETYLNAVDAHKNHQKVFFRGKAIKLRNTKNEFRAVEIDNVEFL